MNDAKGEALMKAANSADPDAVRDWVEHGVPVDARSPSGWTPLMAVANKGHLELVQYLVAKGADVEAKNQHGWTPLLWATLKGATDVVRFAENKIAMVAIECLEECPVINTPLAAVASAVAHATGHQVRSLPITPEKALLGE